MNEDTSQEVYPSLAFYQNAAMSQVDRDGAFAHKGTWYVIDGAVRIGTIGLMRARIHYSPYPSFCGGAMVHSPQVTLRTTHDAETGYGSSRGWISPDGGVRCRPFRTMDDVVNGGLVDVDQDDIWPNRPRDYNAYRQDGWSDRWMQFGYRMLANAALSSAAASGRAGVICCGPEDHKIGMFVREAVKIQTLRKTMYYGREFVPYGQYHMPVRDYGMEHVKVSEQSSEFFNSNSHNQVRVWTIVTESMSLGGLPGINKEEWDEEFDHLTERELERLDWNRGRFYAQKSIGIFPVPKASERLLKAEQAYAHYVSKDISRQNWSN